MRLNDIEQSIENENKLLEQLFDQADEPILIENADIDDDDARSLQKSLRDIEDEEELEEFENAYEELYRLSQAMEHHQFGRLIGKRGGTLDYNDILEIRREIGDIFRNNKILSDANVFQGKDGYERLRLIPHAIYSSLNKWGSFLISQALAWTSVGFFASAGLATLPIIALIGGAALSALFFAAGVKQHNIAKSIKSASKVLGILDAYEDMNQRKRPTDDRSTIRKFFDFLMRKSPRKINREAQEKVTKSARKAAKRFDKLTEDLPEYIVYYDRQGNEQHFPTVELFTG